MKKNFLISLIIVVILIISAGCTKRNENTDIYRNDKYADLGNIEKIYYSENSSNQVTMYIVYSIVSDEEKDFAVGMPAGLSTCYLTDNGGRNCSIPTVSGVYIASDDDNREIIELAGFPIYTTYKTLKAGSNEKVKYISKETIDKRYVDGQDMAYIYFYLSSRLNTTNFEITTSIEKKIDFKEIKTFKYNDNSEFVEEFKKDYNL